MANETSKPVPPGNPGGKTAAETAPPVAAAPAIQPVAVAAPAAQSVPLFGGHRGGGKKRADGLPAGSPEAIAADKEKNRLRMAQKRAETKVAPLPPALPGGVAPCINAPVSVPAGAAPMLDAPAGAVAVAGAAPMFVPWAQKKLEKPAALLTKILDRVRSWHLMKKVKQLGLTPEQEKEIAADLKWKDEVVTDFNLALAEVATIELNKRRVNGSEHAHWVNLAMCGGEMALVHVQTMERLEKMVAANKPPKNPEAEKPTEAVKK